jgi:hypothetical protein
MLVQEPYAQPRVECGNAIHLGWTPRADHFFLSRHHHDGPRTPHACSFLRRQLLLPSQLQDLQMLWDLHCATFKFL